MSDLEERVLEVFRKAGKPLRPGEVAEILGVDRKEVDAVIKKLKREGKLHSPKRCYYAPS